VRWSSFERTLSVDRARAFIGLLDDFDDVEAESRAFALAASYADFEAALRFLMEWPSLVEAARMIQRRSDGPGASEAAELWAQTSQTPTTSGAAALAQSRRCCLPTTRAQGLRSAHRVGGHDFCVSTDSA